MTLRRPSGRGKRLSADSDPPVARAPDRCLSRHPPLIRWVTVNPGMPRWPLFQSHVSAAVPLAGGGRMCRGRAKPVIVRSIQSAGGRGRGTPARLLRSRRRHRCGRSLIERGWVAGAPRGFSVRGVSRYDSGPHFVAAGAGVAFRSVSNVTRLRQGWIGDACMGS